jgi:hypothetical protein
MHVTKPPLQPEPPKVAAAPKSPAPVQPRAPLQKAPAAPIRSDSTRVVKTPLPTSVTENDKIGGKSVQPNNAPTKPILPAAKTQAPANSTFRVTCTALPTSAPKATIPTTAARSASNQLLPHPPSPARKTFSKESSSAQQRLYGLGGFAIAETINRNRFEGASDRVLDATDREMGGRRGRRDLRSRSADD